MNQILVWLWEAEVDDDDHKRTRSDAGNPMPMTARRCIEALVAAASEGNQGDERSVQRTGGWHSEVFDEFVVAALDTITYTLLDAFERLADGYDMG